MLWLRLRCGRRARRRWVRSGERHWHWVHREADIAGTGRCCGYGCDAAGVRDGGWVRSGRATLALGRPGRPTLQGQRGDAVDVSCVVIRTAAARRGTECRGSRNDGRCKECPDQHCPGRDVHRCSCTARQCGTLILSLCVGLLDLGAIADDGFLVEHGVLETDGFAHRRRLVATEERRPAVRDERLHRLQLVVAECRGVVP